MIFKRNNNNINSSKSFSLINKNKSPLNRPKSYLMEKIEKIEKKKNVLQTKNIIIFNILERIQFLKIIINLEKIIFQKK